MRDYLSRLILLVALSVTAIPLLFQSPSAQKPVFEVATVKPSNPDEGGFGGMGTRPGGLFRAGHVTLLLLMRQAYRVQDFQIVGAPEWINSDRFDIEAKAPEGSVRPSAIPTAVPDDIAVMLQSLLEDRFQLKLHREKRDLPVYTLTFVKEGKNLKSVDPPLPPGQRGNGSAPPENGALAPGSIGGGRGRIQAAAVPMSKFISVLSDQLRRPVTDKTGLTGFYDIGVEFSEATIGPDGREYDGGDPEHPSIFTAVQEQLGLRLVSTKAPVDVVVIDSVQKPRPN